MIMFITMKVRTSSKSNRKADNLYSVTQIISRMSALAKTHVFAQNRSLHIQICSRTFKCHRTHI